MPFPHGDVGGFNVLGKKTRVKQRIGHAIGCQSLSERPQCLRVGGKTQRQGFVRFQVARNQLRQAHRIEQARCHPSRKCVARDVNTGSPAQSASLAVACALYGSARYPDTHEQAHPYVENLAGEFVTVVETAKDKNPCPANRIRSREFCRHVSL